MPRIQQSETKGKFHSLSVLGFHKPDLAEAFHEIVLRGDRGLGRLWASFTHEITIDSSPPGARVYIQPYSSPDEEWTFLGQTPVEAQEDGTAGMRGDPDAGFVDYAHEAMSAGHPPARTITAGEGRRYRVCLFATASPAR